MMKTMMLALVAALAAATPAVAAPDLALFGSSEQETLPRATLTFDGVTSYTATATGWIDATGSHTAGNDNYLTGRSFDLQYNSFFNFVVPALSLASPYTSATLTLKTGRSRGTGPFDLSLYDVDAGLGQLGAERSSGDAEGQALFADLGSGVRYGGGSFSGPYTLGDTIVVTLDQAFLDRINRGLLTDFSIGGTLFAPVAAVPEPATWAFMIGGIGLVGGTLRRRPLPAARTA